MAQITTGRNMHYGTHTLLGLPRRVRDQIYQLALAQDEPVRGPKQAPLTTVNHQLRRETLAIFYGRNIFLIDRLPLLAVLHLQMRHHNLRWIKGINLAHTLCTSIAQARDLIRGLTSQPLPYTIQEVKVKLRVSTCSGALPRWKNVFASIDALYVQYDDCPCGRHVRDLGDVAGYAEFEDPAQMLLDQRLRAVRERGPDEDGRYHYDEAEEDLGRVNGGGSGQQGCCMQ